MKSTVFGRKNKNICHSTVHNLRKISIYCTLCQREAHTPDLIASIVFGEALLEMSKRSVAHTHIIILFHLGMGMWGERNYSSFGKLVHCWKQYWLHARIAEELFWHRLMKYTKRGLMRCYWFQFCPIIMVVLAMRVNVVNLVWRQCCVFSMMGCQRFSDLRYF